MSPRKLSRRETLGLAAASAAGAALVGVKAGPWVARRLNPKWHILFIVADALRADMVGRTVKGLEITPNINRLAEKSLVFSNAYATSAQTKFSVASLMTGLYPGAHGVEQFMHTLPDCPTLQRFLSARGYRTVAIGANPYLEEEGFLSHPGDLPFGFQNGFDEYYYLAVNVAQGSRGSDLFEAYVDGSRVNAFYFNFLERFFWKGRESADQPHFAYLHYMDSHQPWVRAAPVPGVTGKFHNGSGDLQAVHAADRELMLKLFSFKAGQPLGAEEVERLRAVYMEGAHHVDMWVGAALDELERHGILENTMIVFTADHGDELYEHGRIGHAQNLMNVALRVPLMLCGVPFGKGSVDLRVSNAAIFPTFVEVFGGDFEAPLAYSLLDFTRRGAVEIPIFASMYKRDALVMPDGAKYMETEGEPLFFNIVKDPGETTVLAPNQGTASECHKLRAHQERYRRDKGVLERLSTHEWQNAFAAVQRERARAAVAKGEMTAREADMLTSTGGFLSETEFAAGGRVDPSGLSDQRRNQLRALGYLN